MKVHTTNYKNNFIKVAEDISVEKSEIPAVKRNKTLANIQYEMLAANPYKHTSDDVLFECFAQKNNITESERKSARETFFSKGQPCLRSSALAKRYGFGFHFNDDSKVALVPMESTEYENFSCDENLEQTKAMRNKQG
ncbi:DUF6157 family protein [Frigoriflavimonas asaccharolytica]|uniref:Uncharacterized protein n=1 Tax=Frigoriflavimonas asaccharolytica TaxID=2735899 RepID=A0A8J8K701_9FLAO|nr:DUF6157 family protein [Frigoriflavimonas asaccharolytica]NRS91488.1 hypothetical protein [Frigoriflavimonas asaccharolytica]